MFSQSLESIEELMSGVTREHRIPQMQQVNIILLRDLPRMDGVVAR